MIGSSSELVPQVLRILRMRSGGSRAHRASPAGGGETESSDLLGRGGGCAEDGVKRLARFSFGGAGRGDWTARPDRGQPGSGGEGFDRAWSRQQVDNKTAMGPLCAGVGWLASRTWWRV